MPLSKSLEITALNAALDSWSQWREAPPQRPEPVAALSNGQANRCWLVTAGQQRYVVRISTPLTVRLKLSWEQELRAALAAEHAGIAPRVLFTDPIVHSMVLAWAGQPASTTALQAESGLLQLAELTSRLHQLQPAVHEPGYTATLERYAALGLEGQSADSETRDFARYLDLDTHPRVFCHHDLTSGNILLKDDQLLLVDWEYARLGHALFDLGSLAESLQLDQNQERYLLESYGAPSNFFAELADMRHFIRQFSRLWEQAWNQVSSRHGGSLPVGEC